MALALNNLGSLAWNQGDYVAGWALYGESLALRRAIGDKWAIATSLTNLGLVAYSQDDYTAARTLYEESLALHRAIGNKSGIALALVNLGNTAVEQDDGPTARAYYAEGLLLARDIGHKQWCVYGLSGLAATAGLGQPQRAARLAATAETLRLAINLAWESDGRRIYERSVATARAALNEAAFAAAWAEGQAMTLDEAVAYALASEA